MSNDYFNASSQLARNTQAKAGDINGIQNAVKAGFDLLPGKDALQQDRATYAADTGVANAYVVALPKTITAYATGLKVRVKITNANTGASTLNVDGLGVRNIRRQDGTAVAAGDLGAGDIHELVYDGTNFVLQGATRSQLSGLATDTGSLGELGWATEAAKTVSRVNLRTPSAYVSRTGVTDAIAAGALTDLPAGSLVFWEGNDQLLAVKRSSGATAISDMAGFLPAGDLTLDHWGPDLGYTLGQGDAADDSAALVTAAASYMAAMQGSLKYLGKFQWSAGYVNLGSTVVFPNQVIIEGHGPQESFIHADHTDGPAIRLQEKWSALRDLSVSGSTTRAAGTATQGDYGVLIEGTDAVEGVATQNLYFELDGVYFVNHPDDDAHIIGPAAVGQINRCSFAGGKGHAIYIDRGEKSGRSNLVEATVGRFSVRDTRFGAKPGHSVCVGSPNGTYTGSDFSSPALAVLLDNCEGSAGTDAAIRYRNAHVFLRGPEHQVSNCGFNHDNALACVSGRDIRLFNNRLLNGGFTIEFDASDSGVVNTTTDTFTLADHELINGDLITYRVPGGGSAITGLTNAQSVFVTNRTDDTFQVSATRWGPPVNLTALGGEAGHEFDFGGHVYIIETYDELPTENIFIKGFSIISPPTPQYPSILITKPAGETTYPTGIFIDQESTTNSARLVDVDESIGNTIEFDPASAVDTGADTFTVASHGFTNHEPVVYSAGGGTQIGGLTDGDTYFVDSVSGSDFQLFSAIDGTAVNLTSAGSGSTHRLFSGRDLNTIPRVYVNGEMLPKVLRQDVPIYNSTSFVRLHDLDFDIKAGETAYFEWEIEYESNTTADLKVAMTITSGSISYGPKGGLVMDASGSVVAEPIETSGGSIVVTGAASGTRRLTISGHATSSSDAQIRCQFAQNTGNTNNTTIKANATRLKVQVSK